MGRAKLPMKLVENEKSKKIIFSKRKLGLKKKAMEFGTLCGVDTLLICYGPEGGLPETWPENSSDIVSIVQRYKCLTMEDREKRKLDLTSYLEKMIAGARRELEQNQKKSDSILYRSWDDHLDGYSEVQLRTLIDNLDGERLKVKLRVDKMGMYEKSLERNPMEMYDEPKQNQLQLQCLSDMDSRTRNYPIQEYVIPIGFGSPCFDVGSQECFQGLDPRYQFGMERRNNGMIHDFMSLDPISFSPPPIDPRSIGVDTLDTYYDDVLRRSFPARLSDHGEFNGALSVPMFKRSGGLLSDVISSCNARMDMAGDGIMSNDFEF